MVLYGDDGNGVSSSPSNFITSSDEADLIDGTMLLPLQIAATLNPGKYWVFAVYNGTGGNTHVTSTGGSGRTFYASQDYLTSFPSTFPTSRCDQARELRLQSFPGSPQLAVERPLDGAIPPYPRRTDREAISLDLHRRAAVHARAVRLARRGATGCIPPAGGVPYLPGPPQWLDPSPPSGTTRPQVDDPRWAGAYRQDFPTQFGTEATFRALNSGGYLYFTLQSLIDPNGTTSGDTVWLGLGDGTNSHLLMFDLDSASGAGPTSIAGSYWSKAAAVPAASRPVRHPRGSRARRVGSARAALSMRGSSISA